MNTGKLVWEKYNIFGTVYCAMHGKHIFVIDNSNGLYCLTIDLAGKHYYPDLSGAIAFAESLVS